MASSTQDNVTLAQGAPTVAVGQSLKTARELTGRGIDEVAEQLRIRQPFLQALEDGRHKDLPGGTYAVGFLRTYAEFLGLDGEEMVRRFRAEAAGELNARSELVFPSPVSEGRIPGGAVLFLGVILAGVAYAGWYFLSARSSDVAEMVPPLPDRLASALNRPATVTGEAAKPAETPKPEEAQPKAEDAPPGAAAVAAKDGEVVPPTEEEEAKAPTISPAPTPVVPTTAPTAPAAVPKADPVKLEAAKADAPKAEPVKPAAPVAAPAAAPASAQAPTTTATTPAPTVTAAPAAVAPAQPQPTAALPSTPTPEGKVIGQEHSDSRVQLKATADDCWVQVREMDGQLLLSRLLRRGDSYMVPNRPGLTLMVGNAGALEISVDGKKAAPLGASGQVRRDIKLDPDKLQAGG